MSNKLIFTSYGLNTKLGRDLISQELSKEENLKNKKIFLFHEPYYSIEKILEDACVNLGFKKENVILSGQQKSNVELLDVDYVYVTEGNTFEILLMLRERGLDSIIEEAVKKGATYIGSSAGAMIAGTDVEEALNFDRNYVGVSDFKGLCLFDGIVIPHYTKEELERYVHNSPGIERRYKRIFSVGNEESFVIDKNIDDNL